MPPPHFEAVPEELRVVLEVTVRHQLLPLFVVGGDDEAREDGAHVSYLRRDPRLLGPPGEHVNLVGVLFVGLVSKEEEKRRRAR